MTPTVSIKHSPAPSQINRNPQTKGLFTLVPIIQNIIFIIEQKITRHTKRENTYGLKRQNTHQNQNQI